MLEQNQNHQQFVPGVVLTPDQRLKLINEKVQRAEIQLRRIEELARKLKEYRVR